MEKKMNITLNEAIVACERLLAEKESADNATQIKNICGQLDKVFRYIFNTFKTREAHTFLWETVPDESPMSKRVAEFTYKR
jgi:hypothetical protein